MNIKISLLMFAFIALTGCDAHDVDSKKNVAPPPKKNNTIPTSSVLLDQDHQVKASRELYWEERKTLESGLASVTKEPFSTKLCVEKETRKDKEGRVSVLFSWSKSDVYDAAKWVYLDKSGRTAMILSTYQKGSDHLELRLYLRPDGSEISFDERWPSRSSSKLPSWNITRAETKKPWVPGC